MKITSIKGRSITAWAAEEDTVIVAEKTGAAGRWIEDRVILTRAEIAKLAQEFPEEETTK